MSVESKTTEVLEQQPGPTLLRHLKQTLIKAFDENGNPPAPGVYVEGLRDWDLRPLVEDYLSHVKGSPGHYITEGLDWKGELNSAPSSSGEKLTSTGSLENTEYGIHASFPFKMGTREAITLTERKQTAKGGWNSVARVTLNFMNHQISYDISQDAHNYRGSFHFDRFTGIVAAEEDYIQPTKPPSRRWLQA